MKYKLLYDGKGVILSRQPMIVDGDVEVKFDGAPDGAVALFVCGKDKRFRTIESGVCTLPKDMLSGSIEVSVINYDGTVNPHRWTCEGLFADTLKSGEIIISPDDNNLPAEVAGLKIANHKLNDQLAELERKFKILSEKFTSMMEGYDLV